MRRSMSTMSGCSARARSTASMPSAAVATISTSSIRPSSIANPSRTTGWSSAIRTRMGIREPRSRPATPRSSGRPTLCRRPARSARAGPLVRGRRPFPVAVRWPRRRCRPTAWCGRVRGARRRWCTRWGRSARRSSAVPALCHRARGSDRLAVSARRLRFGASRRGSCRLCSCRSRRGAERALVARRRGASRRLGGRWRARL